MKNTLYFFPKNKTFWLYHGSLLAVMTLVQLVLFMLVERHFLLNIIIQVSWLPLYTGSVLIFRHYYQQWCWQRFSMTKQIPLVLLVSLILALMISLLLLAVISPFFWSELFSAEVLAKEHRTLFGRLADFIFGNSVISLLFISTWAFMYIAVTTNRQAKESELKNLRLENSLKEAELSSLTNQLNPHFLFNSLNNIRFMIHENAAHADKMITTFSEILRYSLTCGKKDKIAIENELTIIESYIDIMRLQLGERLDFHLNFSPSCQHSLIPPMTLQLLVENAIKHGIENIKTKAQLSINITNKDELLIIEVCNPVANSPSMPSQSTGTGLKNIKQRLNLLYGKQAQLSVTRVENTFMVTLALPTETSS